MDEGHIVPITAPSTTLHLCLISFCAVYRAQTGSEMDAFTIIEKNKFDINRSYSKLLVYMYEVKG